VLLGVSYLGGGCSKQKQQFDLHVPCIRPANRVVTREPASLTAAR